MRAPDRAASMIAVVLPVLVIGLTLEGCQTPFRTSSECREIADPVASIHCQDEVMFGNVIQGTVIGAVGGAVLGGAVAFAASGGRNYAALGRGTLIGGMVGGVAGGVTAYMNYLNARYAADATRSASANAADMAVFGRQLSVIGDKVSQLASNQRKVDAAVLTEISEILHRADQTEQVHVEVARRLGAMEIILEHQKEIEEQKLKIQKLYDFLMHDRLLYSNPGH
jgi:uncharacterized protein YcfJ